MIEFRQLRYLVAIVDAGSFSRASARLHVAQPALSQQIADLEATLGTRLLVRSVKGVVPTEAGSAVYRHAQSLLNLREQTHDVARRAASIVSGRVRLGLPSSLAMILAVPLVEALAKRHPEVLLELHESPSTYLAAQLFDERVDLSLLVDREAARGLVCKPLVDELIYYAQARQHRVPTRRRVMTLPELANRSLILTTKATTLRFLLDEVSSAAGVKLRVKAEASSIQSLLTVLVDSDLGTLLPYSALSWPPTNRLLRLWPVMPAITRRASIAWPRDVPLSLASQAVFDIIGQVIADLVHSARWQGSTLVSNEI